MKTDLRHLEVEAIDELPPSLQDDLEDLREGYPFEAVRRNRSDLDRNRFLSDSIIDPTSEFRTVTARFDDKLVGWMDVRNLPLLETILPVPARFALEELIQRNRNDVRDHLLEWFRDQFPDELLITWHPTQNRTARQFLQSRGFQLARTLQHLGRDLPSSSEEADRDLQSSAVPDDPVRDLPPEAVLPGWASLLETDPRESYLEEILRLHEESDERALVGADDDSLNLLLLRGLGSDARAFGEFLLADPRPEIIDELVGTAVDRLSGNPDSSYLELIVPDAADEIIDELTQHDFSPLTKRMFHLDVPEPLEDDLDIE